MAVPGKKAFKSQLSDTLRYGSEEHKDIFCHPCELSRQKVDASGYCRNCMENLCEKCITSHKTATSSRGHVIDKSPKSSSAGVASDKLHQCAKHQNEEIKFYCRAHENIGCVVCMTLSHKLCDTAYIPEVSEKFSKEIEYLHYEKCIEDLKESFAVNISKLEADSVRIEENYDSVMSEIKKRRHNIQDYLDKVQSELENEALTFKKRNQDLMRSLKNAYEALAKETVNTESITSQLKKDKKYNSLFCEVKQARKKISEIQSRAYEIATRYQKEECKFKQLEKLQRTKYIFGTIQTYTDVGPCSTSESLNTQPICHLNIRSENDKKTCYATGLEFVSCDLLAVADKVNKNVKIIDVVNDKIVSEIKLSSCPRDVTVIPPDRLAVTLGDEKVIQLLSTTTGLTKAGQIKTDGHCRGIQFDDRNLIVTFDNLTNPRVEMMTLSGEVLKTFQTNDAGKLLLRKPKSIGLTPNGKQIYVTDTIHNGISRLSIVGQRTAVSEKKPFMGIAVSRRGSVFACSKLNEEVCQFADNLSNMRVVLRIKEPIALAICHARNMLCVSCGNNAPDVSDKLHVFKIN